MPRLHVSRREANTIIKAAMQSRRLIIDGKLPAVIDPRADEADETLEALREYFGVPEGLPKVDLVVHHRLMDIPRRRFEP